MPSVRIPLLLQVSGAHLISHLHIMTLPVLLPLLPSLMGVSFIELGLALSVFNVVSAMIQAPMGFAVDRYGGRRILMGGLLLGSLCFLSLSVFTDYTWLLIAMALAGVANGVYHPADYSLLSQGVAEGRVGRAFSLHTFAGYVGSASAPALLLGVVAFAGPRGAFVASGLCGLLMLSMFLLSAPKTPAAPAPVRRRASGGGGKSAAVQVFTPAILSLTFLYVLLSMSTSSLDRFSVTALVTGYDIDFATANVGLTAYLLSSASGVLAGGWLADRTQRHGAVAACAFGMAGLLTLLLSMTSLSVLPLAVLMGTIGFLVGIITPSRDMLVRAAAPPNAQGRVFGIVSTGFNIGGAIGPVYFGWLLDTGRAQAVFWSAAVFMGLTVATVAWQGRRAMRRSMSGAGAVP